MSDDWSHWVRIEIAKSKKGPFNYLGIYQIRVVTASGDPIPICRLGGVDPFGLLYMGRSGDHFPRTVQNRVKEFAQLQHSGGRTYARAYRIMERLPQFAGHRLEVRAQPLVTREEIDLAEGKALDEYFLAYGELPPCNSQRAKVGEES